MMSGIITTKQLSKLKAKYILKEGMSFEDIIYWLGKDPLKDSPDYLWWKEARSYVWLDPLKVYIWVVSEEGISEINRLKNIKIK